MTRSKKVSEIFEKIKYLTLDIYPELSKVKWRYCGMVDDDQIDNKYNYAHVLHIKNKICVAHNIKTLDAKYIAGIFAHEFGHLMLDITNENQTETRANKLFEYATEIKILYDKNKVQYIKDWKRIAKKLEVQE